MLLAVPLMLLGAFVLVAAAQWRNGQWVESARWVLRRLSPHVLVGTAAAGIMVFGLGLMLIWPPGFLLAFGAAIYWLWTMARSAQEGARGRIPEELLPARAPAPPATAPAASPPARRTEPAHRRPAPQAPRRRPPAPEQPADEGESAIGRLARRGRQAPPQRRAG
jgi:hypothetical protein